MWQRSEYSATMDEIVSKGRVVCIVPVRKVNGVYRDEQKIVPDPKGEECARLILSVPTMLSAMNPRLLEQAADRLVNVHGENANVDFVLALRAKAEAEWAALAVSRLGAEAP